MHASCTILLSLNILGLFALTVFAVRAEVCIFCLFCFLFLAGQIASAVRNQRAEGLATQFMSFHSGLDPAHGRAMPTFKGVLSTSVNPV